MADAYKNTDTALAPGERVRPIDIGKNNLASIVAQGVGQINFLQDNAPVRIENFFGVRTGVSADLALQAATPPASRGASVTKQAIRESYVQSRFSRGDVVYDTEHAKKVTVIQANASTTTKGKPVHKVATRSGRSWLQKESKLQPL